MASTSQNFPGVSSPFVDMNGNITQVWLRLLVTLWSRTGSATGSDTESDSYFFSLLSNAASLASESRDSLPLELLSRPIPKSQDPNPLSYLPTLSGINSEYFDFTPTVYGTSTAGSNSYTTQNGSLVKLGPVSVASFEILMSTKDGTMAGNIRISGLPVPARDYKTSGSAVGILFGDVTLAAGGNVVVARIPSGADYIELLECSDSATVTELTAASIENASNLEGTLVYFS